MRHCPNCGANVDDVATSCPECELLLPRHIEPSDARPSSSPKSPERGQVSKYSGVVSPKDDTDYGEASCEESGGPAAGSTGVVTQCRVIYERRGCSPVRGVLGLLAVALVLIVVSQNSSRLVGALLPWVVLGVVVYLLASWVGVAGCLGRTMFGFGGLLLGGSLARSREETPVLSFRMTPPGTHSGVYRDVHLSGHQDGVGVGDTVRVVGIPINGRFEAYLVVNESAQSRLYRQGSIGLVFNVVLIVILLVVLIALVATGPSTAGG
jgi:hypothetical protein